MEVLAILTSAGVNTGVCIFLFSLYSVISKQPCLVSVYFGQRLSQAQKRCHESSLLRLIPSASWLVKAWHASENDISAAGGLDAVAFERMILMSLRMFSLITIPGLFFILPVNYSGKAQDIDQEPSHALEKYTILNVSKGSKWLWVHCLVLYLITFSVLHFLYKEYKKLAQRRVDYLAGSRLNPSYFTVLVRGIPRSSCTYSASVTKHFTKYYESSYLSHQIVYPHGIVPKLMMDAEEICHKIKNYSLEQQCETRSSTYVVCGGVPSTSKIVSDELESTDESDVDISVLQDKECAAALVFFKTRAAALGASKPRQSWNPMLWVTEMAPSPSDIYWKNLCIPYRLLWFRKAAVLLASIALMVFFLAPVTFVQGLVVIAELQKRFPFLSGLLKRKVVTQLVSGYLPSVILLVFLLIVPPLMIVFSTLEGCISRNVRKKSTCLKVLFFYFWNLFFVNICSGIYIDSNLKYARVDKFVPSDFPTYLANAVPTAATFFKTYVMTSGWAGLACELIQPFGLLWMFFSRTILKKKGANYTPYTFPYHTEIPRVLLFGLVGFSLSILAPLILPLIVVYFGLAFLVYRNQILNVYVTEYQSGGQYWPIVHNTIVFSLLLSHIIAVGVFTLRESTVASGFTFPLMVITALFFEYCRKRFQPLFNSIPAQMLIEFDQQDEQSGDREEIHKQLRCIYNQFDLMPGKCGEVKLKLSGDEGQVDD